MIRVRRNPAITFNSYYDLDEDLHRRSEQRFLRVHTHVVKFRQQNRHRCAVMFMNIIQVVLHFSFCGFKLVVYNANVISWVELEIQG